MTPEANPQELDEQRLQRDIEALVERGCGREGEYDQTQPIKARKSKPKAIKAEAGQDRSQDAQ